MQGWSISIGMFTKGLLTVGKGFFKGGGIGTIMKGLLSVGSSITERFIQGWRYRYRV